MVKQEAENVRVSVRNIRRDSLHDLKELLKAKEIPEDDERRGHQEIQVLTDRHITEIDKLSDEKQKEIMEF